MLARLAALPLSRFRGAHGLSGRVSGVRALACTFFLNGNTVFSLASLPNSILGHTGTHPANVYMFFEQTAVTLL